MKENHEYRQVGQVRGAQLRLAPASGTLVWRIDVTTFLPAHPCHMPCFALFVLVSSLIFGFLLPYLPHHLLRVPFGLPRVNSSPPLPSVSVWPLTIYLFVGWLAPISGSAVARKLCVGKQCVCLVC